MSSKKADQLAAQFGANINRTVAMRPPLLGEPAGAPAGSAVDRYAGAVKSRAFAELPLDAIERDDGQPREEFDPVELTKLAESIKRFGQLAPIRVRRDEARNRWVVLVGERRLRACRLAGLDRVRVEFVERAMTDSDILAEQVVENVVRADLRPVEEGRAYRRLMELNGWHIEQLAETIGAEPTTVHHRLGLLRLPEDIAEQVDQGTIRATAAYEISKLPTEADQRAVASKVLDEGLDYKETVAEVRKRQPAAKAKGKAAASKARRPTSQVFKTPSGARVTVENRRGLDPSLIVEALRQALEHAEADLLDSAHNGQAA